MAKSFTSPGAFKTSLEARLKTAAAQRHVPINTLRLKLVIERLLARLFDQTDPPWLLKGGYAMELRYRPRARTTRDIDLTCHSSVATIPQIHPAEIRDKLQATAEIDMGDYLSFRVENARLELAGAPMGGARFPSEAFLAGKTYGRFHIDVGFGDDSGAAPEVLMGDDLMAFAGIPPARVLAIAKPQQFAEKLHAYTHPWADRTNMRTKDLVDMVLMIETHGVIPDQVRAAVHATFARRKTHPVPREIPDPPTIWASQFAFLAAEAQLDAAALPVAIEVLREFWLQVECT